MKIFNNHGRKNLPRQINYLQSPVIIRSFDHSKNERKKIDVNEITKRGAPLLFRALEALKSLNNKNNHAQDRAKSLTFTSAKRSVSSISCRSAFVNCKAKDISIKFAYSDYSTWLKVNKLIIAFISLCC